MKITPLILAFFSILSCYGQKNNKEDIQKNSPNFKRADKVQSIIESGFRLNEKFGDIEKEYRGKTTYSYNLSGNLLEQREDRRDGSTIHKFNFKYNDKDSLIEYFDMQSGKTTYDYDQFGNVIEQNEYKLDFNLSHKIKYKFDSTGKMTVENHYSSNGDLTSKKTFKYNNKGGLVETLNFNADGILVTKNNFKFNEKGNLTHYYEQHGLDGSQILKESYRYNLKGNKIEELEYQWNGDSNKVVLKISYNELGNKIEEKRFDSQGNVDLKVTYKYDVYGNILEVIYSKGNTGSIKSYKYEYDQHKNWVKKTEYKNDKPVESSERKIVYF